MPALSDQLQPCELSPLVGTGSRIDLPGSNRAHHPAFPPLACPSQPPFCCRPLPSLPSEHTVSLEMPDYNFIPEGAYYDLVDLAYEYRVVSPPQASSGPSSLRTHWLSHFDRSLTSREYSTHRFGTISPPTSLNFNFHWPPSKSSSAVSTRWRRRPDQRPTSTTTSSSPKLIGSDPRTPLRSYRSLNRSNSWHTSDSRPNK